MTAAGAGVAWRHMREFAVYFLRIFSAPIVETYPSLLIVFSITPNYPQAQPYLPTITLQPDTHIWG